MKTNFITPSDLCNICNEFKAHANPHHYISVRFETNLNYTFNLDIYYTVGDSSECHEIFCMHRIDKSCMYDVIYTLSNLTYTFDFNFYLC